MFGALKFSIYFAVSFFILCIPVKNEPLFSYIHAWVSPHFSSMVDSTEGSLKKGLKESKKLFDNSAPDLDAIKEKSAGISKNNQLRSDDPEEDAVEEVSAEEKAKLREIIQNHNK